MCLSHRPGVLVGRRVSERGGGDVGGVVQPGSRRASGHVRWISGSLLAPTPRPTPHRLPGGSRRWRPPAPGPRWAEWSSGTMACVTARTWTWFSRTSMSPLMEGKRWVHTVPQPVHSTGTHCDQTDETNGNIPQSTVAPHDSRGGVAIWDGDGSWKSQLLRACLTGLQAGGLGAK